MNTENIFVKSIVAQSIVYASGPLAPQVVSLFKEYGIQNILSTEYINLNILLSIFQKISFQMGPGILFNIGKTLSISINFFDNKFNNLQHSIDALNNEYHNHHQILSLDKQTSKKILGNYSIVNIEKEHIILRSTTLYPCEFDKGLLYKLCLHFSPNIQPRDILHSQTCRNLGNNYCDYLFKIKQISNV